MVDKNKMSKGVLFGVLGVSCLVIIIVALAAWLYFNAPKKVKRNNWKVEIFILLILMIFVG